MYIRRRHSTPVSTEPPDHHHIQPDPIMIIESGSREAGVVRAPDASHARRRVSRGGGAMVSRDQKDLLGLYSCWGTLSHKGMTEAWIGVMFMLY